MKFIMEANADSLDDLIDLISVKFDDYIAKLTKKATDEAVKKSLRDAAFEAKKENALEHATTNELLTALQRKQGVTFGGTSSGDLQLIVPFDCE